MDTNDNLFLHADAFEKAKKIAELPIADWVYEVSEGTPECVIFPKSRTELKEEYFESRREK